MQQNDKIIVPVDEKIDTFMKSDKTKTKLFQIAENTYY